VDSGAGIVDIWQCHFKLECDAIPEKVGVIILSSEAHYFYSGFLIAEREFRMFLLRMVYER
jgi:hypothetical protein